MKKGILLLALGHPYYGRMALNLAMSIKKSSDIPIALAYAGEAINHLDDNMKAFFSHFIEVPKEHYTSNGVIQWIKAKTAMYELSPFDKTIFLDADTVWLPQKPVDSLFNILKGVKLTFQNRGKAASDWCEVAEINKVYGEGDYYDLSSEFVYFENNKKNEKFFKTAFDLYDNLEIKFRSFAGGIPDELLFSIAMIKHKTYPHQDNFTPVYWEHKEKRNLPARQLYNEYFAYSVGGASNSNQVKQVYNNLIKFYGNHYGVQHPFPLIDKRQFLQERKLL